MAGKRIVHVNRDLILTSDRFIGFTVQEWGAYYVSLCNLAKTEEGNPLRGCLCCGSDPMTIEDWRIECGFHRISDAQKVWDSLFQRQLLVWHEHQGKRFAAVARFSENQDRLRRTSRRDDAEIEQTSCRDRSDIDHVSRSSNTATQRVTNRKTSKLPQEPLTLPLTAVSPNGDVDHVNVVDPLRQTLERIAALPADADTKARLMAAERQRQRNGQRGDAHLGRTAVALSVTLAEDSHGLPDHLERERLLALILRLTGDTPSTAWWTAVVGRLCATAKGTTVLQNAIGELERRLNSLDAPSVRKPGGWLTTLLQSRTQEAGIALPAKGNNTRPGGPVAANLTKENP